MADAKCGFEILIMTEKNIVSLCAVRGKLKSVGKKDITKFIIST